MVAVRQYSRSIVELRRQVHRQEKTMQRQQKHSLQKVANPEVRRLASQVLVKMTERNVIAAQRAEQMDLKQGSQLPRSDLLDVR